MWMEELVLCASVSVEELVFKVEVVSLFSGAVGIFQRWYNSRDPLCGKVTPGQRIDDFLLYFLDKSN